MHFSNATLSALVLLTLVLSILVILVLLPAVLRAQRRTMRSGGLPSGRKVAGLLQDQAGAIERLEGAVRKLALGERHLGELADGSIRHVGLVRFDAFEDMGGRLSFAAAFLDGHGDGVVITSINGRQDTRCYAKQIAGGTSPHNLSDEERQAIKEALLARERTDQGLPTAGSGVAAPVEEEGEERDVQAG